MSNNVQLEIVKYLHSKNVIYVDVKPENFMVDLHQENKVRNSIYEKHQLLYLSEKSDQMFFSLLFFCAGVLCGFWHL